jgi:YHS domain-containing protein
MTERRAVAPNEDPVCGMTVDLDQARAKGLVREFEGREYGFCGKGCFLEFGDDPEAFLAPGFQPSM